MNLLFKKEVQNIQQKTLLQINFLIMIPIFPTFKKISLDDELSVKSYTNKYKPYSDFNFTSLWSWDVRNERRVSDLNGNLVVYFTDYKTNEPFLSFLGTNKVEDTAVELINYSKSQGLSEKLDLIAEESVNNISSDKLVIEPSEGNTDYVYSVSKLAFLEGKQFKSKRNSSRNFLANNKKITFKCMPFKEQCCAEKLSLLIRNWESNKIKDGKDYSLKQEESSIMRLFEVTVDNENLLLSTVDVDDVTVGFSIDEVLVDGYAISHFIKADISYRGIYEFMNERIAEALQKYSIVYWNWEQDLGEENLKSNKLSYRPVDFLKKYKITLK